MIDLYAARVLRKSLEGPMVSRLAVEALLESIEEEYGPLGDPTEEELEATSDALEATSDALEATARGSMATK